MHGCSKGSLFPLSELLTLVRSPGAAVYDAGDSSVFAFQISRVIEIGVSTILKDL